jgi:RND family efflux transporter MFP subunit
MLSFALALPLLCLALGVAQAQAQPASAPGAKEPAALVQVRRLADVALFPERDAPATVVARNETRLSAEVAARVLRWTRDVGETVARGELLLELDATDFRLARERAEAALQGAQARLQLASTQLTRARELVGQGFLSQEAVNQRETEVRALQAEVAAARSQSATAQQQIRRTRVLAPFAASVRQRMVNQGEVVAPGAPLYVLVERGGAELSAAVAPADAASLQAARQWTFEAAGTPGPGRPLRLLRVGSTVSAPARTVEARLAPASGELPVGSDGLLRWRDERPHLSADWVVRRVVQGRSQLGVFVVEGAAARFVSLPQAQEGRAVPSPLPADAQVVVQGQAALAPGQAVQVQAPSR